MLMLNKSTLSIIFILYVFLGSLLAQPVKHTFVNEPTVVKLTPAINFQIGEQYINRLYSQSLGKTIDLGTDVLLVTHRSQIDFEKDFCQINLEIAVSVPSLQLSWAFPYSDNLSADAIDFEITTQKLYIALNKYQKFSEYIKMQYSSMPQFVQNALVQYFNKYYLMQEELVSQFGEMLESQSNDQVMENVPLFWEGRKTVLTTAFDDDFARFTITIYLENEQPRIEFQQKRSGTTLEILVVTNFAADISGVAAARTDLSRNSRYYYYESRIVSGQYTASFPIRNQNVFGGWDSFTPMTCTFPTTNSSQFILIKSWDLPIERVPSNP